MKLGNLLLSGVLVLSLHTMSGTGFAMMGGGGMMANVSHETHWTAEWGPKLGNKCYTCHNGRPSRRTVSYSNCIPCHSPDGAYDGVNDPVIGARYNWGRMSSAIYDGNGQLRPGKEKWCAGCHDDGTAVIDDVPAPNVTGKSMSGDWKSPASVLDSDFPDAENLLNNDLSLGLIDYHGTYVLFDFGSPQDISHIRLYTGAESDSYWEVYGGNDPDNLDRILLGQAILFARPSWEVGPEEGWNSIRLDSFIQMRYLKLIKISPWSFTVNGVREFEFKKDLEYGYYANGHKLSCDNCHDVKSSHIDGLSRTYQADQDNYNSGYRLTNVQVDWEVVPAMQIPRTGCSKDEGQNSNDFALCFKCHDKSTVLGDTYSQGEFYQDPLQTNFRNDTHVDENGKVSNEHLRHILGRGYCGNTEDWDSDWDGVADSPISCTACHNVHGSPTPAMTRHGELTSPAGTNENVPMINFQYLDANGTADPDLSDVMESTGGQTQFYGPGPGKPDKNATCKMCHNDQISYQREPVAVDHGLLP